MLRRVLVKNIKIHTYVKGKYMTNDISLPLIKNKNSTIESVFFSYIKQIRKCLKKKENTNLTHNTHKRYIRSPRLLKRNNYYLHNFGNVRKKHSVPNLSRIILSEVFKNSHNSQIGNEIEGNMLEKWSLTKSKIKKARENLRKLLKRSSVNSIREFLDDKLNN